MVNSLAKLMLGILRPGDEEKTAQDMSSIRQCTVRIRTPISDEAQTRIGVAPWVTLCQGRVRYLSSDVIIEGLRHCLFARQFKENDLMRYPSVILDLEYGRSSTCHRESKKEERKLTRSRYYTRGEATRGRETAC